RDHEFTFLDHAIRCGDALLGLSIKQIEAMQWPGNEQLAFVSASIRERVALAIAKRERIRVTADTEPESTLRTLLREANEALDGTRRLGDVLIEAFFAAEKPKDRERRRKAVVAAYGSGDAAWPARMQAAVASFPAGAVARRCFHWEIEFPEVFVGEAPGFDAVVGNPPYAGKNTLTASNVGPYIAWLQTLHDGSHGNSDLVAHFFRRSFDVLRHDGTLSFVATNTIRQGDTRATGLYWIRRHSGVLYNVTTRYKWAGEAAVVVSVIHILKGMYEGSVRLDGRDVERITAYLFERGDDSVPVRLAANSNLAFVGSYPLGMGFTFDDTDAKGVASPLALMHELIEQYPRNAERIKPYIGGKEVLTDAQHRHHRYIIDFGKMSLAESNETPDLLAIVRENVKPARDIVKREVNVNNWWIYAERRPGLYAAITPLTRVLVKPQTSARFALAFLPNGMVYDQTLIVISLDTWAAFAALQSRVHETWATFFGPTMEDRQRYAPSDVFETYPFPDDWGQNAELEQVGKRYFDHRAALMHSGNEGLTQIYNRFHDPTDMSAGIVALRELHAALDRATFTAYGWRDLTPDATFEADWTSAEGDGPIRFTWASELRDTVLTRLLALNSERAAQE
ncbi:MAG: Eco57I restriction-modification methylase domain-containing protein, partial [Candidatus Dormibacteria bacterium]